jgi:hypothetical protein
MQFSDYGAFRNSLFWLIEGEELTNTFSVSTLDLIIGLGEERVYHGDAQTSGLRASCMVADYSATVTDNAADLPADLLELKEVWFDGKPPLEIIPLDRLRALEADGTNTGADTLYCAQDGDTLRFWPIASGTVLGRYYKRPEALASVTWADALEIARYPAVFTFACLFEAALFLGMHEKAKVWEARYRQLSDGANHSERMRTWAGGPLKARTR